MNTNSVALWNYFLVLRNIGGKYIVKMRKKSIFHDL